jgi:hypothetical protein
MVEVLSVCRSPVPVHIWTRFSSAINILQLTWNSLCGRSDYTRTSLCISVESLLSSIRRYAVFGAALWLTRRNFLLIPVLYSCLLLSQPTHGPWLNKAALMCNKLAALPFLSVHPSPLLYILGFPLLCVRLLLIRLLVQNLCIVFNCPGVDMCDLAATVWGQSCSARVAQCSSSCASWRCIPRQALSLSGGGLALPSWSVCFILHEHSMGRSFSGLV